MIQITAEQVTQKTKVFQNRNLIFLSVYMIPILGLIIDICS